MATRIYASEKFDVYKVTDPDDRTILPLTYTSLRDPFSVRQYMGMGKIFIIIDNSVPLVRNTFEFFEPDKKEQVVAFLATSRHYRNRINEPFDLHAFFEKNPELKEIPEIKEEIEKYPIVQDFWNY